MALGLFLIYFVILAVTGLIVGGIIWWIFDAPLAMWLGLVLPAGAAVLLGVIRWFDSLFP